MSKLSDKMKEVTRELLIFNISEFYDLLTYFDETTISNYFIKDFLIYLNDSKTQCLTVTLSDNGVSIQHIWENLSTENPIFLTKNLNYDETLSLIKTILRRNKLKKLNYG